VIADLLDLPASIPEPVRSRLQDFADRAAAQNASLRDVSERMREAQRALASEKSRLVELEYEPASVREPVQARIERATKVLAEQTRRVRELEPTWQAAFALSRNAESYVRANANAIVLHTGPEPALQKGESAVEGLARAEARTRALEADWREVLAAPIPSADAKRLARLQIEARIEAARPDVTRLIDHGGEIEFPTSRTAIEHVGPGEFYAVDAVGLAAWLFPDAMAAALDREIDAVAEDEIALSTEARRKRLAVIDGDLLRSQREEAAFAELAGVLPRADIDPRAALGLAATMPASKRDE
jgi:hypothetical protein